MVRGIRFFLLFSFLVLVSSAAFAADPVFPRMNGRPVVDDAGILSAQTESILNSRLMRMTSPQVAVATIKDLEGNSIEEYGYKLARAWGIGSKAKNDGIVVIVAPADRATRIEVGYGLEGELTDAISRSIIERRMIPFFRQGDYDQGVLAGVDGVLIAIGQPGIVGAPPVSADAPEGEELTGWEIFFLIVIFLIIIIVSDGRGGPWGGGGSGRSGGGFTFRGGGGGFGGGGASGRW